MIECIYILTLTSRSFYMLFGIFREKDDDLLKPWTIYSDKPLQTNKASLPALKLYLLVECDIDAAQAGAGVAAAEGSVEDRKKDREK